MGVPFRRGIKGKGGLPRDFELADHGLRKLKVESFCGIVFGTLSDEAEPLEDYLDRAGLQPPAAPDAQARKDPRLSAAVHPRQLEALHG